MADKTLWLVMGDKPGDNAQLLAIAKALDWPYEVRQMIPRQEYIYGKPPFKASLYHLDPEKSDPLSPPWPDLVLTVGRRPAMAAQWIRQQSGGKTKVILLGRPKKMLHEFALVILTGQYLMPPGDNILFLDLPLMQIAQQRMDQAAAAWQSEYESLKKPLTAVLIGGPTKPYRMDEAVIADLLTQLQQQAGKGSLFISTSRRSPDVVIDYIKQHLPADSTLYCWRAEDKNNPYLALLGRADAFVVTGDSLSMMVEIARLGKPLFIYPLPQQGGVFTKIIRHIGKQVSLMPGSILARIFGYSRDLGRIHRYLINTGLASILGQDRQASAEPVKDQLEQVVQRIKQL
ncbi:MAG: mitochondrial fission ELM1 family protein [gamma proteobacterium symbiont of Bathyaustriella thionipta]|nr:mitochondrial fission ELM1 family protein [gamma proteobacterium symbiont of Bathyaustriella thionipta]